MMVDIKQTLYGKGVFLRAGGINKNARKMLTDDDLQHINRVTVFIPPGCQPSLSQRLHAIREELTTIPTCSTCGAPTRFVNSVRGYQPFCSTKCASQNIEMKEARRLTNMERYGGSAPFNDATVRERAVATNLERYDSPHHQTSAVGSELRRKTMMERYGHEYYTDTTEFKAHNEATRDISGIHHRQQNMSIHALAHLNDASWLRSHHIDQELPVYAIADALGVSTFCVRSYLERYDIPIQRHNVSYVQREVINFIASIYSGPIIVNDRTVIKPNELDVLLPEIRVAFEINGVYWHGETKGKTSSYHVGKTKAAAAAGVRVMHIREDLWKHRQAVVRGRIANALGVTQRRLHARRCHIREIGSQDAASFMEMNHIQGPVNASVRYGLYHNEELVTVCTLGRPRYNADAEWELLRLATVVGTSVAGGASKLFQHFIRKHAPSSVLSYCDLSWNTGGVYEQLGFVRIHDSKPSYAYFNVACPLNVMNRVRFQKHKLHNLLPGFNPTLTEWDNMRVGGYDRIWDCGSAVFLWSGVR